MAAPKGNQFWKARSSHGANPKFTKDTLWPACVEYFEWVEDNPLQEQKMFHNQGEIVEGVIYKMRAMTLGGLQLFLDITHTTWNTYREDKDLLSVTTRVDKIIRDQKFTGAAADLFNPNIIARDLGLRDGHDHTTKGDKINDLSGLSTEELIKRANAAKDVESQS